jgi:hypothetical protein
VIPLAFEVAAAPDLLPGHELSFVEVGFDEAAIRVEYAIEPAFSKAVPGAGWVAVARDDLGNEYEDVGGAYGPAGDGDRTEGTLSLPFPVEEAATLRVRLFPGDEPTGADEDGPAYELIVSLEL